MDKPLRKSLNYLTLAIFAPVLILTGALGFVLPPGPMSAAPAYNVFHIVFGAIGVALVLSKREASIRTFNVVFGLIDLYQAVASFMHWFPERQFQWKTGDDVLHVVIGAALVLIGLLGRNRKAS
jgi:hypothetical protein